MCSKIFEPVKALWKTGGKQLAEGGRRLRAISTFDKMPRRCARLMWVPVWLGLLATILSVHSLSFDSVAALNTAPKAGSKFSSAFTEQDTTSTQKAVASVTKSDTRDNLIGGDDRGDEVLHHGNHVHTKAETRRDSGKIFLIMLICMLVSQLGLSLWRKHHQHSFDMMTLIGLFFIPFFWSIMSHFWRMLAVWMLYSGITAFVVHRALRPKIARSTPRLVYTWFHFIYKLCYGSAVGGYALILCDFTGISLVFPGFLNPASPVGFMLLFYGTYYGVLGRDCANMCTELMAAKIGYYSKDGMPSRQLGQNVCAICDAALFKNLRLDQDDSANECIFTLSCNHQFHESCIRGWTVVGKRDTCPTCHEKVNLRATFSNPWETEGLTWGVILDALRFLIVYNPLIVLIVHTVLVVVY